MFRTGGRLSRYALPIAVILLSALAGLLIPLLSGNQLSGSNQPWTSPTVMVAATASPTATRMIPASPAAPEQTQEPAVQPTATSVPTATPEAVTPTPEPTVTPTVVVMAEVTGDGLNLRAGPAIGQPLVGTANTGDRFTVIAKSADTKWLQVCCVNEKPVWLAVAYVKVDGSLEPVPVAP